MLFWLRALACTDYVKLKLHYTTLHYTTKGHDEPHLGVNDGFHLIPRCLDKLKSLDTVWVTFHLVNRWRDFSRRLSQEWFYCATFEIRLY